MADYEYKNKKTKAVLKIDTPINDDAWICTKEPKEEKSDSGTEDGSEKP